MRLARFSTCPFLIFSAERYVSALNSARTFSTSGKDTPDRSLTAGARHSIRLELSDRHTVWLGVWVQDNKTQGWSVSASGRVGSHPCARSCPARLPTAYRPERGVDNCDRKAGSG